MGNISKKRTKDSDGCPQRMHFHVSYSLFGVALTFYVRHYIKLHCHQEEAWSCSAVSATSVMLYWSEPNPVSLAKHCLSCFSLVFMSTPSSNLPLRKKKSCWDSVLSAPSAFSATFWARWRPMNQSINKHDRFFSEYESVAMLYLTDKRSLTSVWTKLGVAVVAPIGIVNLSINRMVRSYRNLTVNVLWNIFTLEECFRKILRVLYVCCVLINVSWCNKNETLLGTKFYTTSQHVLLLCRSNCVINWAVSEGKQFMCPVSCLTAALLWVKVFIR